MCCIGYLSDKFGRKVVVYVSGSFMAIIPLILIITDNFTIMIAAGLVFGLAYGGYITYAHMPKYYIILIRNTFDVQQHFLLVRVDFALASDVLPRTESHATDLGVWHISWVLPTVIPP